MLDHSGAVHAGGRHPEGSLERAAQAMADDLFEVVSGGQVKIRIDQRVPRAKVAQAHRELEARRATGSTVLLP